MLRIIPIDPQELLDTIHSLSGFTLMVHKDFKPVYVKEDYAQLYGFKDTATFMQLDSILELIPEELHELAKVRYDNVIEQGSSQILTVKTQDIDGNEFWIKLQDRRIQVNDEACVMTALLDITEEIELQENYKKLAKAEKHARSELFRLQSIEIEREKQSALNQLLIGVSHQLNTPLGNILTSNTVIENTLENTLAKLKQKQLTQSELVNALTDTLNTISILDKSARRADKLIKDVKLMVGDETQIEKTDFYLASMVADSILLFTRNAEQCSIQIDIDVDIDDKIYAHANPHTWMKILNALCDNTIQHGFKDRSRGKISVSARVTEACFEFSFSDDGAGIDIGHRVHIFEAFYSTQMGTHSGLGLTLVYSLVHRVFDGTISIETPECGEGISFLFKLPLNDYGLAREI